LRIVTCGISGGRSLTRGGGGGGGRALQHENGAFGLGAIPPELLALAPQELIGAMLHAPVMPIIFGNPPPGFGNLPPPPP
jgi:hypothetical protein